VKSVPKDHPIEMEPLPEQSNKKDDRKLEYDEESDWEKNPLLIYYLLILFKMLICLILAVRW
jgi:hypothetical protein